MKKVNKEEKSKHKLQKRFMIISGTLLIGMLLAFFASCYFPYLLDLRLLFLIFVFIIQMWFVFDSVDYKIFNSILQTLICTFISLLLIVFGINVVGTDAYIITASAIPISSIIVMLPARKLLGTKLDDFSISSWNRMYYVLFFVLPILLSVLFYNLILKHLISH